MEMDLLQVSLEVKWVYKEPMGGANKKGKIWVIEYPLFSQELAVIP
jgi:hypothetical protein